MRNYEKLRALAIATPDSRDRYVDLVRAFSIAVVVLGHWLMAIVYMDGGSLTGANALDEVPGLWIATWVLQVMPLFFMVGGFANLVAWRSMRERGGYSVYLRTRVARLLRPTTVFIGIWIVLAMAARAAGVLTGAELATITEIIAKPLWFLAVYILVIALAPAMVKLYERHGFRVLLGLAAGAMLVDVLRIGAGWAAIGYVNFALVWLFVHQLGFHYADGRLTRLPRRTFAATGLAALGALALLTGSGIYSPSMVGMASEAASNNSPPSICLILLSLWLGSAAMLIRPAARRWLQGTKPWTAVIAANSMIMTVFLWHLTALLIAVIVLFPLGFPQPPGGSAVWWAWRPLWIAILGAILTGLVALFARFERPTARKTPSDVRISPVALAGGVAALVIGLAGFAQFGFAPSDDLGSPLAVPFFDAALVAIGYMTFTSKNPIGGRR